MSIYSSHRNRYKYSVYLSESFHLLESCPEIIDQITKAGLIYFGIERASGIQFNLDKVIQQNMEAADIVVFYAGNEVGNLKQHHGRPITEFEYAYAKEHEKPILAYISRDLENRSDIDWIAEIEANETYRVIYNEAELAAILIADLLKMIQKKPGMSCWIRSDLSYAKVDSIIQHKITIDRHLLQAGYYIRQYEKNLDPQKYDQIVGPLIDIELRPNISGQAYRFAAKQTPQGDIKHGGMKYLYFIDRFEPYEGGIVYDRLLDVTWLIVNGQNFSWQDAMDWKNTLDPRNRQRFNELQLASDTDREWRLPDIEELMTLITEQKQGQDYFDKTLYPGDVHWFWSSTFKKDEQKAYYIETTQGSVLKDELEHMNAILLCCDGKPKKPGKLVHIASPQTPEKETDILLQANKSLHIYGVFLSIYKSEQNDGGELVDLLMYTLKKGGYEVDCNLERSSRTVYKEDAIIDELENHEVYLLILDRTVTPKLLDRARLELSLARSLNLPILIYHSLPIALMNDYIEKLELSREEAGGLVRYKDAQRLAAELIPALNNCIAQHSSTGWIRRNVFEAINECIEKINYHRSLLESSEPSLNVFIEESKVQGLRKAFESFEIVSEKPIYGEQTWFVSRDNPIQRFFPQELHQQGPELPILFERFSNRFEPLVEEKECIIVYDGYLQHKWWAYGVKKTSFQEAIAYAQLISQQRNEDWRLPTIEEMLTLLTRDRVNRKYMDEKIFPLGRWFWTASSMGQIVYYIDYNYLQGSIRREDLSQFRDDYPILRKKSVILISNDSVTPARAGHKQPSQSGSQKPSSGEKYMDPASIPILLSTINFLFGEVSKIFDERREHRKKSTEHEPDVKKGEPAAAPQLTKKEDLLSTSVSEKVWQKNSEEIEHLTKLLHTYTRNYYLAQEQLAQWTLAMVPAIIIHQLDESEAEIVKNTRKLEKALSVVFGKKVIILSDTEE